MTGANDAQPTGDPATREYFAQCRKLRDAALTYARAGIPVFPCTYPIEIAGGTVRCCLCHRRQKCDNPGEHPRYKGWRHNASTDPKIIDAWWTPGARSNIGICTGAVSGLIVLDVDPPNGGNETLAALERRYGPLPPTWRFLTGGGGQHILFKHLGGYVKSRSGALGPGLDIKADGGFIIVPPSEHISGRRYAISVDHHPADVPLARPPEWLIKRLGMSAKRPAPTAVRQNGQSFVREPLYEGQRNSGLASLAGLLVRKFPGQTGFVSELVLSFNARYCRPPLDEKEVQGIVASIGRYDRAPPRAQ